VKDAELKVRLEKMNADIAQSDPRFVSESVRILATETPKLLARIAALREAMTWKAGVDLALRLEESLAADDKAQKD